MASSITSRVTSRTPRSTRVNRFPRRSPNRSGFASFPRSTSKSPNATHRLRCFPKLVRALFTIPSLKIGIPFTRSRWTVTPRRSFVPAVDKLSGRIRNCFAISFNASIVSRPRFHKVHCTKSRFPTYVESALERLSDFDFRSRESFDLPLRS